MTRRDFGKLALTSVPAMVGLSPPPRFGARLLAQADGSRRAVNRSFIGGVQFGLQPFCYHDLAMTPENRRHADQAARAERHRHGRASCDLGRAALQRSGRERAGSAREAARLATQQSGRSLPQRSRRSSMTRGSRSSRYYVNINDSYTDAEIDAVFDGAKLLGANGCVGSQGLEVSERLARFPGKHGMFLGLHNHDNLSDPDAFNNEASFVKGLAFSPDVKATLDTRHFTAANGDCLAFPGEASRARVERAPRRPPEEQRPEHAVRRRRRAAHRGAADDPRQPVADRRAARVRAWHAAARRSRKSS